MGTLVRYMSRDIPEIGPEATLKDACDLMKQKKVSFILVVERDRHVGILTEADVARRAIPDGHDPNTVKVRTLMISFLITLDAGRSVEDANELMKEKRIRHLLITENGKVTGVLTMLGLLRYFYDVSRPNTKSNP